MSAHFELQIPAFSDRLVPASRQVTRNLSPEGRYLNLRVTGFVFQLTRPLASVILTDRTGCELANLPNLGTIGWPGQYVFRLDTPLPPLQPGDLYSLTYVTDGVTNVTCQLTALPKDPKTS